jgi:uncharacterized damage-inducible protein DinB
LFTGLSYLSEKESQMEDFRYPVGQFSYSGTLSESQIETAINDIKAAPAMLREMVKTLNDIQLDTPYRRGGWTVRQVVHHLADSHINAYVRLKLALTENKPMIRPYNEVQWAELPDASDAIEPSLNLLDTLHTRWVSLFRKLKVNDWHRRLIHPEMGEMSVDELLAHYAWHGRHHIAHIAALCERMRW